MTYLSLFTTIILISAFCIGLRTISAKGFILYFLRIPYERSTGFLKQLLKPVIGCCTCMASIHGTWIFIFMNYGQIELSATWFVFLVLCCISAAGLNHFIYTLIELMDERIDFLKKSKAGL